MSGERAFVQCYRTESMAKEFFVFGCNTCQSIKEEIMCCSCCIQFTSRYVCTLKRYIKHYGDVNIITWMSRFLLLCFNFFFPFCLALCVNENNGKLTFEFCFMFCLCYMRIIKTAYTNEKKNSNNLCGYGETYSFW